MHRVAELKEQLRTVETAYGVSKVTLHCHHAPITAMIGNTNKLLCRCIPVPGALDS